MPKKVEIPQKKKQQNLIVNTIIARPCYSNGFRLRIYKTRKTMFNAIKNNYEQKRMDINLEDAVGVVFETDEIVDNKKEQEEYKLFANMYLNEEDINVDVIAHECTHATFMFERNVMRYLGVYDGNDGTGDSPEERFAYTLGSFVDEVIKACIENKVNLKWREVCSCEKKDKKE